MSNVDNPHGLQKAFYLHRAGKLAEAAAIYRAVLADHPEHPEALHYLGVIEASSGHFARAKSLMTRALKARPANIQFIENYATLLLQTGDSEAAVQVCERGLQLNQADIPLLYVSAAALLKLNRLQDSIAQFDKLLLFQPNHVIAINERGSALAQLKKFDEALASFAKALALEPLYAEAHFNEALCRLLIGDFDRGLEKYEWRWGLGEARTHKRDFKQPQWTGQGEVAGKTVLLYAEQGFGDTIQFCRYAPLVAARGARVILEVQEPLHALLGTLSGEMQIVSRGDPLPDFDMHCPLLSLPRAFATRLDTIPSNTPYLRAPPTATDRGCRRPRIGLAWASSPTNRNAHNKSIRLSALQPLLHANAQFVSLQKDLHADDATVLHANRELLHSGHKFENFADTAALMSSLDLIISVDTSVAHLAGALGKLVWILLPFIPDWRWQLDREDSPWYPTARLFRQDDSRAWDGVIGRVCSALHDYVGNF